MLSLRDKNYHKFYALLMQTQMFTKFIEERSFVSETNTALAFFDECIAHCESPERFLELEFPDSDRTVFIMPPDNAGMNTVVKFHSISGKIQCRFIPKWTS